jgi:hypothetical protein
MRSSRWLNRAFVLSRVNGNWFSVLPIRVSDLQGYRVPPTILGDVVARTID